MASTPSPPHRELATRLREIREGLKLTRSQLAAILSSERSVQGPTISTWESKINPVRPPSFRVDAYARLLATAHREDGAALRPLDQLSESERAAHAEALTALTLLYNAVSQSSEHQGESQTASSLWDFPDDGPLAIICPAAPPQARGPLADPADPNYTETHSYADLDALLDIYGHLRMEIAGRFPVTYTSADRYRVEDLSAHLVLLGGIGWNELSKLLQPSLTRLPVRQLEVPDLQTGEIFEVVDGGEPRQFYPEWSDDNEEILYRDVGYIARTRKPLQPSPHIDHLQRHSQPWRSRRRAHPYGHPLPAGERGLHRRKFPGR